MAPAPEAALGDWLRRLAAVPGVGLRRALWGEALRQREAAAAATLVDGVVVRTALREPAAIAAYLPLVDLPGVAVTAGPGVLGAVLLAARQLELPGCQLLLEHPGAAAAPERLGPPPDPALDTLTLGRRKTVARGRRSPLLERLLADPDPRVVREVLRNPRLREWEVVAIASRRPCPGAVFQLLAASETWVQRPAVRSAMVFNPHAPTRLAVALAVLLNAPELEAVAEREQLHPALRDGAVEILTWRRGAA